MDILIVKKPWIDLILDGEKTWEIRGCDTKKRGRILLAESGTGLIRGSVELHHTCRLLEEDFETYRRKHQIPCQFEELPYKEPHIWWVRKPNRFEKPVPYKHPQGAVIWVKGEAAQWQT